MGVFKRKDSPYWWIYLETAKRRERTSFLVGQTIAEKRDSRQHADQVYHDRMQELAARVHRLPTARPAIRFSAYAAAYETDVIAHHKGAGRERELLAHLVGFFGSELLSLIDQDRARAYLTARRMHVSANTANREVDLLKAMLRSAVPKYLDASPLAGMKRLRIVKTKRRLLQPEEEARLLTVATDPQDYAILVVGLDTLVRLGDLLDLQRTDREGLWLTIRDPKQGDPYDVPLSRRAAAALDAITHDRPYYFEKFRRASNPRDWGGAVRQRLERLCKRATPPVPYGMLSGITFHGATRKTGATRLLIGQGVALPVVQQLGNWKRPDVLLRHYTEAQRGDLLAAVGQSRRPSEASD